MRYHKNEPACTLEVSITPRAEANLFQAHDASLCAAHSCWCNTGGSGTNDLAAAAARSDNLTHVILFMIHCYIKDRSTLESNSLCTACAGKNALGLMAHAEIKSAPINYTDCAAARGDAAMGWETDASPWICIFSH